MSCEFEQPLKSPRERFITLSKNIIKSQGLFAQRNNGHVMIVRNGAFFDYYCYTPDLTRYISVVVEKANEKEHWKWTASLTMGQDYKITPQSDLYLEDFTGSSGDNKFYKSPLENKALITESILDFMEQAIK